MNDGHTGGGQVKTPRCNPQNLFPQNDTPSAAAALLRLRQNSFRQGFSMQQADG